MTIITKNSLETQKVAALLAKEIMKDSSQIKKNRLFKRNRAMILALQGDLGTGKTTFIQGFAKGLGIKEKILSPTFVILKRFKIPKHKIKNKKQKNTIQSLKYFYHLDCYRIKSFQEIIDLRFKEIVTEPQNIIVIEWAERIKKILPKNSWWLEFRWLDKNRRKIIFKI